MKNKKSLYQTHKELMKEWDCEKNDKLGIDPKKLTYGSHKKVWWICHVNINHKWISIINNRSKGSGCPYCSGKKVYGDNCLAIKLPELSKEWNYEKNGKLKLRFEKV